MKVYVYPADETGCGYYRLIWPAQSLKAAGVDVTVVTKKNELLQFQAKMVNQKMVDVITPPDADVMVFQRPTHKYLQQAIPLIRSKGIAVVVDMDDDLTCIDPRNPAWRVLHPDIGVDHDHAWSNVQRTCESATLVTVSSPALLNVYGRRVPGRVLYNYVPRYFTEALHIDRETIGWGGSVHSHPDDLQTMGPAIGRITRDLGGFTIVGPDQGLKTVLGSSVAERVAVTGPVPFLQWHQVLNEQLGVGVAPTADTRFNQAKSWLKPLEYAAVGVVPVSSPRAEYVRLHLEHDVGLIVNSPKDWYRTTKRLATNPTLRAELSLKYREIVAQHLTIEDNAHRWYEVWTEALRIQRS